MKHRIPVAVFLFALAACDNIDIPQTDVTVPAIELAIEEVPERGPHTHYTQGVTFERDRDADQVSYSLHGREIFVTSMNCDPVTTRCHWEGPIVFATSDREAAYSLPGSQTVVLQREGRIVFEIPTAFDVQWIRHDGENYWALKENYLEGEQPPLLFNERGEIQPTPKFWEAR